ncbi:hypothetical protein RRG08_054486 [Elysia crispata]|uniref:Uncharacterized protein n=1 Tax=Elysia crispata TaxID=231223 RepID=A0AAE0Y6Z3_9GAST|nr:hypothetical protein RRG08_054486 [Elysia crispata]
MGRRKVQDLEWVHPMPIHHNSASLAMAMGEQIRAFMANCFEYLTGLQKEMGRRQVQGPGGDPTYAIDSDSDSLVMAMGEHRRLLPPVDAS